MLENSMMNEIEVMAECCGDDGKPDLNKMKAFMEKCGKKDFSEGDFAMMKHFCPPEGTLDSRQMKQFMENRGCRVP
jgi:hypothetical protein